MIKGNDEIGYVITCDSQPCESEVEGVDFRDCVAQAKLEGWTIIKGEMEYIHTCPTCLKG